MLLVGLLELLLLEPPELVFSFALPLLPELLEFEGKIIVPGPGSFALVEFVPSPDCTGLTVVPFGFPPDWFFGGEVLFGGVLPTAIACRVAVIV
jgi:hypothetical protein